MQNYFKKIPQEKRETKLIQELEKAGWRFEGPFYSEAPSLDPNFTEKCTLSINRLTNHILQTFIISDPFDKNHIARRSFEKNNPNIASFNSKFSKLGANNLFTCYSEMDSIINKYKKNKNIHKKLINTANLPTLLKDFIRYNNMSFDEKVNFAKKIDETVFNFLSILK